MVSASVAHTNNRDTYKTYQTRHAGGWTKQIFKNGERVGSSYFHFTPVPHRDLWQHDKSEKGEAVFIVRDLDGTILYNKSEAFRYWREAIKWGAAQGRLIKWIFGSGPKRHRYMIFG